MNYPILISLMVLAALHVAGLVALVWSAVLAPAWHRNDDVFCSVAKAAASRRLVGDPAELDWDDERQRAA